MTWLRFHCLIQNGHTDAGQLSALAATFESATYRLQRLPRMFLEPDGSFVWTGMAEDGQSWQVDGNLIDRGDALDYVELKGSCPEAQFNEVIAALGWPSVPLVFQLPQRGVFLDEAEFRRLAESAAGAG